MAGWLSDLLPELVFGLGAALAAGLMVMLLRVAAASPPPARSAVSYGGWAGVSLSLCAGGLLAAYLPSPSSAGGELQPALHATGAAAQSAAGMVALGAAVLVARTLYCRWRAATGGREDPGAHAGHGVLFAAAVLSVAQIGIPSAGWIWRALALAGRDCAPLVGALAGVVLAVVLCWSVAQWLQARQGSESTPPVRSPARKVSTNRRASGQRPAVRWPLILLAAGGVLQVGTGLAALQHAGWIPGEHQLLLSFDIPAVAASWTGLLAGVMGGALDITWLQLVATLLTAAAAVAVWAWKRGKSDAKTPRRNRGEGTRGAHDPLEHGRQAFFLRGARQRGARIWLGVAFAAPVVLAAPIVLAVQPASMAAAGAAAAAGQASPEQASGEQATAVSVTEKSCAPEAANLPTGVRSFSVSNTSRWPLEVYLIKQPEGGVLARTGIVGPGTVGRLAVVLGPGNYGLECLQSGQPVARSKAFTVTGATPGNATAAIPATATGDLLPATNLYSKYVQATLGTLDGQVADLKASLAAGDLEASRRGWLEAQQTWQTMGAAYGSFGDVGEAVNALPHGPASPDEDPGFTGLHRIEYGLYHGQTPASLVPVAETLQDDLAKLRGQLPSLVLIPANMPLRAHEILEDALRDHLSGQDDQGSGMAYALTSADVAGTRAVLDRLSDVLQARKPGLVQQIGVELDAADGALQATKKDGQWVRFDQVPRAQQQSVNAAVSAALETLAQVPQLLQLPAGSE